MVFIFNKYIDIQKMLITLSICCSRCCFCNNFIFRRRKLYFLLFSESLQTNFGIMKILFRSVAIEF